MSKIGRKPIDINEVEVQVKGQEVLFKGKKSTGTYLLPDELLAKVDGDKLAITPKDKKIKDINRIWGLHRALLANEIKGAKAEFEKVVQITGLGYKAVKSGNKLVLTLGYSRKIDFDLPKNVTIEIDKTGQKVTVKSSEKKVVGQVCSRLRSLRPPEPYKGTGIKLADEVIVRKAGKAKSA